MVEQSVELNRIFAALSDPTRRRILEILEGGERRVTELAEPFRMSLAAVSKHLQVLERAGLLVRRRDGRVHHLRANPEAVRAAQLWIEHYARGWEQGFDALDAFLKDRQADAGAPDGGQTKKESRK